MRQSIRVPLVSLGLLVFVAACQDGPVPAEPVVPGLAKGGKGGGGPPSPSGDIIALGGFLFQDTDLSVNQNQSCQSCHEPSQGFAAPLPGVTTRGSVVQGSQLDQFGDRKPPSAMLVNWAPPFSASGRNASGGTFWDGRATGEVLGTPAADQAGGPFLNPKEQAMPDKACVIWRVATSAYADLWPDVWPSTDIQAITWPANTASVCTTFTDSPGEPVALNAADRAIVQEAYDQVAISVAAFETTFDVFDSRVDNGTLTTQEEEGRKIFESNGKCQQCHDPKGSPPVYTDFEYHNLGVPKNPQSPVYHYGTGDFDPGLGGITGEAGHMGKFKTPSMRNVAKGDNRTYMHNGSLKTLEQVVQFYNTRDVLRVCVGGELQEPEKWGPGPAGDFYNCWPPPEYGKNLDSKNMGDLGLTEAEVDAVVAYLEALTGS